MKTECKDPNLFLPIWAKLHNPDNPSNELDVNAHYCKLSYHYQKHEVTVNSTGSFILKTEPVVKRTNFTQVDKIIDIIRFEGNIGAATTAAAGINS